MISWCLVRGLYQPIYWELSESIVVIPMKLARMKGRERVLNTTQVFEMMSLIDLVFNLRILWIDLIDAQLFNSDGTLFSFSISGWFKQNITIWLPSNSCLWSDYVWLWCCYYMVGMRFFSFSFPASLSSGFRPSTLHRFSTASQWRRSKSKICERMGGSALSKMVMVDLTCGTGETTWGPGGAVDLQGYSWRYPW